MSGPAIPERFSAMTNTSDLRSILQALIDRGAENVGPVLIDRAEKALKAMENMNMDTVSVPRWRKKPVEVDAWQWDGKATYKDRPSWLNIAGVIADHQEEILQISTLEGIMTASKGDWIIRGIKGEVYPCKPDIFAATYEPASTAPASPVVGEDAPKHSFQNCGFCGSVVSIGKRCHKCDSICDEKNCPSVQMREHAALASIPTPTAGRAEALEEALKRYGWHTGFGNHQDTAYCNGCRCLWISAHTNHAPDCLIGRALSSAPTQAVTVDDEKHSDDVAVDAFAVAMKTKLAKKRVDGRGGWDNPDECSVEFLASLLIGHVCKGDPVDIGNLAMMLFHRDGSAALKAAAKPTPQAVDDEMVERAMKAVGNLRYNTGAEYKKYIYTALTAAFPQRREE